MTARRTSDIGMQRRRFLTTPQSAGDRPKIITGPDYKVRRSTEYQSQATQHEAASNSKPLPYKEQIENAYNADRRRVPVDLNSDGTALRSYWKGMLSSIREPIDSKIFEIELAYRQAQSEVVEIDGEKVERGNTYKMNICRDQIAQLENQYLYHKKMAMKLLMDEKLGRTPQKQRMEKDWTNTLDEFKTDVEKDREVMEKRHAAEQVDFREQVMKIAAPIEDISAGMPASVKAKREKIAQLIAQENFDEARQLKHEADEEALEYLRKESPMTKMFDLKMHQRLAALNIKQQMEAADFEHKVESKAVGLAVWRIGMDFVE